jgi:hypothetical protein
LQEPNHEFIKTGNTSPTAAGFQIKEVKSSRLGWHGVDGITVIVSLLAFDLGLHSHEIVDVELAALRTVIYFERGFALQLQSLWVLFGVLVLISGR